MLSYHNDENLKNLVVSEMKKHQEQDQFIKGTYGEEDGKFKGCAVGCTINSINVILGKSYNTYEHNVLEKTIGVPEWLARLQDLLFEKLPEGEDSQFAVDFLSSIPVGINLEPVKWKFCAFILKENIDRIISHKNLSDEIREKVIKSLRDVLNLHESAINTGIWDPEAAESAESAARSEAMSAESEARSAAMSAESAARSAESAESAARSAAMSAESAARSAESEARSAESAAVWSAESAAESAAWSAARSAAWSEVWSAAVWSAESAARSAESAAWSAAESAVRSAVRSAAWSAESAARSAARSAAHKRYADELIRLLKGSV